MAMNNPAFNNQAFSQPNAQAYAAQTAAVNATQLQDMYNLPSAGQAAPADRMTVEDTVVKSAVAFVVLVIGAVAGWVLGGVVPDAIWIAGIIGFALALVNIFKKEPSPALVLAYAGVQGIFVGAMSSYFERVVPGIVAQAVIATLVVVGVTLALFASGKIRASKKATKVFMIALIGYTLFAVINLGLQMFGVTNDAFGLYNTPIIAGIPLGVILGPLVILMGAYSLVLDFDAIQRGVQNRAPRKFAWKGVFGIMVTVIWLYLEILRFIAIMRD